MPNRDDYLELIRLKYLRWEVLKKQEETLGVRVDPSISIEVGQIEAEIRELQDTLGEKVLELWPTAAPGSDSLEIDPPYGTMRPDSNFYIERTPDHDCWDQFGKSRAVTIFVQAPRQMGKSSLMRRILDRVVVEQGKKVAFVDFQKVPDQYLLDEEAFLKEFCQIIMQELGLSKDVDAYWPKNRTAISNCTRYLSEQIISEIGQPFILALDEIGRMVRSPFRTNFFGMLRTWHNDRVYDKNLETMSLFFSSAVEPYLLIDNPYQSPFNVAEHMPLEDFTLDQVWDLNQRHSEPLDRAQVIDLMELLGGHPFLTRLALYQIATRRIDVDSLCQRALEDNGPFGNHLRHHFREILGNERLTRVLTQIGTEGICNERDFQDLRERGLVKRFDQKIILRNKLYEFYFGERVR